MRITQNMMSRGYLGRMNRNLTGLAGSNNKMSSGQRYTRVSDNTPQTARALTIREELYRNEQYTSTVKAAESELSAAEGNLQMMNNIMRNVEDRLLQASNGTIPKSERTLIAKELEGLQGQILQIANAQFSDKYLFAGSGNGGPPFEDKNGELHYNGYKVEDIVVDADGNHAIVDPMDNTKTIPLKFDKDIYVDVGMGLVVGGNGSKLNVDQRSAIKISNSGLDAFGFGKTADGMPNNIYSLLTKTINDVKNGTAEDLGKDLTQFKESYNTLLMSITDVGTRAKYLEDSLDRIEVENINLKTTQQELEATPLEEEAINNKMLEMSWMVTLQLGSKIIPPSIFDFIK